MKIVDTAPSFTMIVEGTGDAVTLLWDGLKLAFNKPVYIEEL